MVAIAALLGSFIPTAAIDVVAVFTPDFSQVFSTARPLKVSVKEDSKLMEHPVETGVLLIDHRIVLPLEIELSLVLQAENYRDTYQTIKQLFLNATLLSVQTRTAIYENQLIQSLPHEESADMFDAVIIALKLKEVLFVTPQFSIVPRSVTKTNTVDRGNQQSQTVTEKKTSVLKSRLRI